MYHIMCMGLLPTALLAISHNMGSNLSLNVEVVTGMWCSFQKEWDRYLWTDIKKVPDIFWVKSDKVKILI